KGPHPPRVLATSGRTLLLLAGLADGPGQESDAGGGADGRQCCLHRVALRRRADAAHRGRRARGDLVDRTGRARRRRGERGGRCRTGARSRETRQRTIARRSLDRRLAGASRRADLTTVLAPADLQPDEDRVVLRVDHALLQRDDAVVSDVDAFGTHLGAALGDVAVAEPLVLLRHLPAVESVEWMHVELGVADEEP